MARRRTTLYQILAMLWRIVRKHPALLPVFLLAGGAGYGYEVMVARPTMVYAGLPQARDWRQPSTWVRIFRNHGFMLGYSDLRGNPLWVSYKLDPVSEHAGSYPRPQRFKSDWRNFNLINHDSYSGSGYDRGHMAPNYAISRLYGRTAQEDSFLVSNISPQKPKLNQKLWQRLEEVEIEYFAKRYHPLWVYAGPIFKSHGKRLKSSWLIEVPTAFYKIYAAPAAAKGMPPRLLAFIMPQKVKGNEPLDRYLVSVDEVETRTGFDFFSELDDRLEQTLEARVDAEAWHLKDVARLPARY